MDEATEPAQGGVSDAFRHEALFYTGEREFVEATAQFIRQGLRGGEPVLVVVSPAKIASLREELGSAARGVRFENMDAAGANPARLIPVWLDFVAAHATAGKRLRGIGEPIWPGRTSEELVECHHHESLLNLAFAETPAFRLLCPYDTAALAPAVIEEARRNHPFIAERDGSRTSSSYRGLGSIAAPCCVPLPEPPSDARELAFDADGLARLRTIVAQHAESAGVGASRTRDLVLAVHEVACNSVLHADGTGVLRVWTTDDSLVYEIRDGGCIGAPLIGRERPSLDRTGGFGLWLANHLCDLVQIRAFAECSVVRLHLRRDHVPG